MEDNYKTDYKWFDAEKDNVADIHYYVLVTENPHISAEINNKYFGKSEYNFQFIEKNCLFSIYIRNGKMEPIYTDRHLIKHSIYSKYPNWTKVNKLCTVENFIKLIEKIKSDE